MSPVASSETGGVSSSLRGHLAEPRVLSALGACGPGGIGEAAGQLGSGVYLLHSRTALTVLCPSGRESPSCRPAPNLGTP